MHSKGTKYTTPVLWDKKTETIVNNESSEIARMFNSAFNAFVSSDGSRLDLFPSHLEESFKETNEWIYHTINDGSDNVRCLARFLILLLL